jgi:DNA polymerase-3 subunit beta
MELDLFESVSINSKVETAGIPTPEPLAAPKPEEQKFHAFIERAKLVKALAHIQNIVERNNIVPILSNVKITAYDGQLELLATDIDLAVSERIEIEKEATGSITIPAHTFYDIVRKLPDNAQIELKVTDINSGKLNIIAGACKFSLPFLPAEDFPNVDYGVMTHKFYLPVEDLISIIDKNRFFIPSEDARYNLNGLYLHTIETTEKSVLRAAATDCHRLSRVELPLPSGASNMPGVIIPRKTVLELRKLLEDNKEQVVVELSPSKIKFSFGQVKLISKLVDGTFPDYDALIPYNNMRSLQLDAEHFAKAVDRVSTITFEKLRAVRIQAKNNQLIISAAGDTYGSASEELAVNYEEAELEIGFNARYLLDITSAIKGDTIEFLFSQDNYAPALVRDVTELNAVYVIMPILL